MKLTILSTLLALFVFTSCQKDNNSDEQPKSKCRLTKVTQGVNPDNDTVVMFKHQPDGLPSSMFVEFPPDLKYGWLDFVYKPNTALPEKIWLEGNDDFVMTQFEYNAQGKLSKAKDFVGHEFTYQYNGNGQVNRVDVKRWGNPEDYYYTTVFDDNGNLIEGYRKYTSNNDLIDAFTVGYSDMDNTVGMLSALNLGNHLGMSALFPGSYFIPFPSKKLVKSLVYKNAKNEPTSTSVTFSFEKDAAGNLTKAVINFDYSGQIDNRMLTWKFEYDCDGQ